MLAAIGFVAAGFAVGVALTAILGAHVYGLLHEEAVRVLDSHMGAFALAYRVDAGHHGFGHDDG